jgi:hypothetical protein
MREGSDIGEAWGFRLLDGVDPSWLDGGMIFEHELRKLGGESGNKPERRVRKPRKPTLVSVAKQASKAGIDVARYEVKPDGTVAVVTGKSEATEANPWLDDFKVTKQ